MTDLNGRLVATLVGALVSLLVLLGTMGAAFATHEEVSKQISLESPYVKDQSLILHRLEQIEKKLDTLLDNQLQPE